METVAWGNTPLKYGLATGVQILNDVSTSVSIRANFIIHRMRNDASAVYVGQYENILRRCDGRLKIHSRRSVLDNESLREHGAIAFIL